MKKSIQTGKFRLFAGMKTGAALLSLVFALAFSACPSPTGGDAPEDLDKTGLEASITAAEAAKAGVAAASSAAEVPLGTKWVTTEDMGAFNGAISTAKDARDTATSQAAINSAKTSLDTAIATFNGKRKDGTAAPLNTSALTAKIAEAEAARESVQPSSTNGSDVAQGAKWVTQEVWTAFDTAINTAKTALTAASQSIVDGAVDPLNTAITTFNNAKQDGSKATGFTAAELTTLIAEASAAKEGVTASAQYGDDVSPAAYWVSQSDLNALTTAITSAQAANDGNRDNLYVALAQALTAFNSAKQTGTVPDKTALTAVIQSADEAKEGVVQAANKTEAPQDSKWATAGQFAPLNTAYAVALEAASSANATKNDVDAAANNLNSAVSAFNSAVNGNGPGFQPSFTMLTADTWANGSIATRDGEQWFKFSATAATQFIHFAPGALTEVYVQVYDSTNTAVGDQAYLSTGQRYTSISVTSGQEYYIKVTQRDGSGACQIGFNTGIAPPGSATLTADTWANGNIATENGEQWFKFTATATTQFIHFTPGALTSVYVQVYNSAGTAVGSQTSLSSDTRYTSISVTSGQEYSIGVRQRDGSGAYQIAFGGFIPPGVPVTTLTADTWANGTIAAQDGEQWFKFTATAATQFIHLTPGALTSVYVQVYNSAGTAVGSQTSLSSSTRYTSISVTSGQVYAIKVTPNGGSGAYQIAFGGFIPPGVPVTTLIADTWANGTIATEDGEQWFKFTATVTGSQYILFAPGTLTIVYMQVYNSAGEGGSSLDYSSTSITVTSGQVYYIKVTPNWGSGAYQIGFNIERGITPALTAGTWTDGDIPTSDGEQWFKFTATVTGAYYVYVRQGTLIHYCREVYDSTRTTPVGSDNGGSIQISGTSGEAYYIKVWPETDWDRGTYRITFNTSGTMPPPSGAAPVTQLTAGTWAAGNLPENGVQWFKFTAAVTGGEYARGEQYIHLARGMLSSAKMQVYNSEGITVGSESSYTYSITVTNGQEYYIKVWPYDYYDSGTYQIAFNTSYDPPAGN
jgi:hypothetical protein